MKTIILICIVIFLSGTVSFAETELETRVSDNRQRIQQLEEELDEMRDAFQQLRNESASSSPASPSSDPIVGTWDCTNKLFNYEIHFGADGRLVQQEAVLGNVKSTTWSRTGARQIVIGGEVYLNTDFYSQDEFSFENPSKRTAWECSRTEK